MSQQELQHVMQLREQLKLAEQRLMLSTTSSQPPAAVSFTAPQQHGGHSFSSLPSPISQVSTSPSEIRRHSAAPARTAASTGVQFRTVSPNARANNHDIPMKRAKTVSVQPSTIQHPRGASVVNMTRSRSSRSTTSTAIPFTGSHAVTPPLPNATQHPSQQVDYSFPIHLWSQDTQHQPASETLLTQAMASAPVHMPHFQAPQQFQQIPGMLPDQFLMQYDPRSTSSLAATFAPSQQHLSPTTANFQLTMNTPLASTCETLTDAPTLGTPMSRRTSNQCHDQVRAMDTTVMNPHNSLGSQGSMHVNVSYSSLSLGKRGCEEEIMGIGQGLPDAMAIHQLAASAPAVVFHHAMTRTSSSGSDISGASETEQASPCDSQLPMPQTMVRSTSNVSNNSAKSNQSLNDRAKTALSRHNKNANISLAPKPIAIKVEPSANVKPIAAAKTAITKTSYKRPQHPKVLCLQCNEYPNGFRGDHELRRHTQGKHQGVVKKWICQDPIQMGIPTTLNAVNPLKKCKQCAAGKLYGAYYNAAAHLRRTHFKIKPARGSKAGKGVENSPDEKHGGKSGGDWPAMSALKDIWVTEKLVAMDLPGAFDADVGDDQEVEFDPAYFSDAPMDMVPSYPSVGDGLTMVPHEVLDFGVEGFPTLAAYGDAIISSANFYEAGHHALSMQAYASPVESSAPTLTQSTMYSPHEQVYGGSPTTTVGNPMAVTTDQPEFDFSMTFAQP